MDKPHILVLHNDPHSRGTVIHLLQGAGYLVSEQALPADTRGITHRQTDLIVLDLLAGSEDHALQLVQQIKLTRELAHTPLLILVTAPRHLLMMGEHTKQRGIAVMHKPFDIEGLKATVSRLLHEPPIQPATQWQVTYQLIPDKDNPQP